MPGADEVLSYGKDLLERVLRTGVQGFTAALAAGPMLDIDTWEAAAVAGYSAGAALVTGWLAKLVGDRGSVSFLR